MQKYSLEFYNRFLCNSEIKLLEKFSPIQRKTNKPELNWNIRNELSQDFSEILEHLREKSSYKPPIGNPNIEVFFSNLEEEFLRSLDLF